MGPPSILVSCFFDNLIAAGAYKVLGLFYKVFRASKRDNQFVVTNTPEDNTFWIG